jgi:hypothetical protein
MPGHRGNPYDDLRRGAARVRRDRVCKQEDDGVPEGKKEPCSSSTAGTGGPTERHKKQHETQRVRSTLRNQIRYRPRSDPGCPRSSVLLQAALASDGGFAAASAGGNTCMAIESPSMGWLACSWRIRGCLADASLNNRCLYERFPKPDSANLFRPLNA